MTMMQKEKLKRQRQKQRKFKRTIAFILLIVFLLAIFFKINNKTEENNNQGNLNNGQVVEEVAKCEINIGLVDIDTFNPILTKNSDVISVLNLIYDGLFKYTKDMELVPNLVSTYNYNANILYLQLKDNIYWHNGDKFTSDDVLFTIQMIKKYGGIYSSAVTNIINVEVVDNYTLKLEMNDVSVLTEYDLTFPIISSKYLSNEIFNDTEKNMRPVGTGMFKYIATIDDKKYVFDYNSKYGVKSQIGTINFIDYVSVSESFANLKNKKVDVIFTGLTNYSEYIGKIGYGKEEYIDNTYMFLGLNKDNKYLQSVNVRKAINYGIDKKTLFDETLNSLGYVSQSMVNPNSFLYRNIEVNYDTDKAKQFLINASLTNQVKLNLLIDSSKSTDISMAEMIKEQLKKINIEVIIVSAEHNSYIEKIKNKEYDMVLVNVNLNSNINMKILTKDELYNLFYFEKEELKENIDKIYETKNKEELKDIYNNIQSVILYEVPYIGLGYRLNTIIYDSNILGIIDTRYNNFFTNISEIYKK